jgi:4-azaleucine resistance transporter AzlC
MLPLWAGVAPFSVAFAVLARAGGFTIVQTELLSLVVFSGAAQVATVTLAAGGAPAISILITTVLLNIRHVLYGLSFRRMAGSQPGPPKTLLAFLLTDEAYGLTVKAYHDGHGSPAFLLGAGVSLYSVWNVGTLVGALLGALIPDPSSSGLDFIFPLTFLALLLPLLRTRRHVLVAVLSGAIAFGLSRIAPTGVTVLGAALIAAGTATALDLRDERR